MTSCQKFNNLYGIKAKWTVCIEPPQPIKQGVWYQYQGEPPHFIEDGYYWTCNDSTHNVYLMSIAIRGNTRCIDSKGKTVSQSARSITLAAYIDGEIIVGPQAANGFDSYGGTTNQFSQFGSEIFTSVGYFIVALNPDGSLLTNARTSWNGQGLPTISLPGETAAGADGPCLAKTSSARLLSKVKVGTVSDSNPVRRFRILTKDNSVLFQRDEVGTCPNAWLQTATCRFFGDNVKKTTLVFNNQQAAYLRVQNQVTDGKYCTWVFKDFQATPHGFGAKKYIIPKYSSEIVLYDCSPDECKIFPKVTTVAYPEQRCPPGTCEIECDGDYCCIDPNTGEVIQSISGNIQKRQPIQPTTQPQFSNYVNYNYENPNTGLNAMNNNNYFLGD